MKHYFNQFIKWICMVLALLISIGLKAQEADNVFNLDAFNKAVSVSAGYTFMKGSETMELLNKVSEKRQLHWAWLMLTVSPRLFTTTWQDKQ